MGWFGPASGDCSCCNCSCSFNGRFVYEDAGLLGSVCLLQFAVGDLTYSSCAPIDIETANITIVLKRNTITITDPLFYDPLNNLIYWEKWKPTAGDVYTADVTLDCGGGETFTQSYSFTIPTPANTSCVCCTEQIPDYLVISASGCCDMVNGTWALTLAGGTCAAGTRTYEYVDNDIFAAPASPCSGACYSIADGSDVYYFYRRGIRLEVVLPATAGPDNVTIKLNNIYWTYRLRGGVCSLFSSSFSVPYTYTTSCADGSGGTPTGGTALVGTGSTFAQPCSTAPTVQVFFS